ncbi:MAG: peptidoglycan-binding protein [Nitriliruptoraceae bacterium]
MSATPASAQTSGYEDVTDGIHAEAIAAITDAGVAEGCEEDRYCPLEVVRRDQMASFLARALGLEAVDDRRFDDVPVDNVHRGAINALAEAGITQGCAPERFCPDAPVSRAEMASFLARGFDLGPAQEQYFHDVGDTHDQNAQRLAEAGISDGCDDLGLSFCPAQSVRREQMAAFLARAQELVAPVSIPMLLQPGDEGPAVQALQQRLENHDYWVGPIDGGYGTLTEQAVLAIQKVHGLLRDGIYGPSTRAAVADPQPPSTASSEGYVVEFDEDRQLVLLVQDGVAGQIFHASGGNEDSYEYAGTTYVAETPNGSWDVYREIDGWRTSHLGELYRPKYFHTAGIAIHGSNSVPAQAASHGCVRVSIDAMDWLWANEALPIGADVLVYGSPT